VRIIAGLDIVPGDRYHEPISLSTLFIGKQGSDVIKNLAGRLKNS